MTSLERVPEPADGDERSILLGWLAFHRNALAAKCSGLDDEQLATRSAPPSVLSLIGLVRHLTEMERVYGTWALGPREPLRWIWGDYTDGGPEWDIDADASMVTESWTPGRSRSGRLTGGSLRTLRWTRSVPATVTACGGTSPS